MDTLVLQYHVSQDNHVQMTAMFRRGDGREELGSTYPQLCRYDQLIKLGRETVDVLKQAREVMRGAADLATARGHLERLRFLGKQLRQALLPDDLIQCLQATPTIRHVLTRCDPRLNGVTLDCIYLWDDFLGFRYATGKELLAPHRRAAVPAGVPRGLPYRGFSIVDPSGDLAAVRPAFLDFKDRWIGQLAERIDFDGAYPFMPVQVEQFEEAVRAYEMMTLICHHQYVAQEPHQSGFVIARGSGDGLDLRFTACNWLGCLGAGEYAPLLVLSISCESGITLGWEADWPRDDRVHGMVDAAIRTGVRHYIGTLIEIPAERSAGILFPFYADIANGRTVGEALRRARLAFRTKPADPLDGGTVLGLAFALYGNPSEAYFCAEGHRTDGAVTATCAAVTTDGTTCPRVICPQEGGFGQRRCNEHWNQVLTCPHCGRFITRSNQWFGVCCDCDDQTCAAEDCGPWHEATTYCPKPTRTDSQRDTGWLRALNTRGERDPQILSESRLSDLLTGVTVFQAHLATNLKTHAKPASLLSALSPSRAKVRGIKESFFDLSSELLRALQRTWNLPDHLRADRPWLPPHAWLSRLGEVNTLRIHIIESKHRTPTTVAVASIVPVRFDPARGPVLAAGDAGHLSHVEETIESWQKRRSSKEPPRVYLVALAPGGWDPGVRPILKPGLLAILSEPRGDAWKIKTPSLDGLPEHMHSFVDLLKPETIHMRLETIRKWIVGRLECSSFVTVAKVQEELERQSQNPIASGDVLGVFERLAATKKYVREEINGKPALRAVSA